MPDDDPIPYVQIAQQQNFSRSDVATTRRAFQDLTGQIGKLQKEIVHLMAADAVCGEQQFQDAWKKREQLNLLNQQVASMQRQMADIMPHPSTARLNDAERREIKGLYQSRLYNQSELASQYGVTQPTISDIVNS